MGEVHSSTSNNWWSSIFPTSVKARKFCPTSAGRRWTRLRMLSQVTNPYSLAEDSFPDPFEVLSHISLTQFRYSTCIQIQLEAHQRTWLSRTRESRTPCYPSRQIKNVRWWQIYRDERNLFPDWDATNLWEKGWSGFSLLSVMIESCLPLQAPYNWMLATIPCNTWWCV